MTTCYECGGFTHVNKVVADEGFICPSCLDGTFECALCDKEIGFNEDYNLPGWDGTKKVCYDCMKKGPQTWK